MTTLVQLSDTHFGTEIPLVVEAVKRAVAEIRPDVVVVSGDITQRARKGQFAAALRFLEALPVANKLVIPGNHDIPLFNLFSRFLTPYAQFTRAFVARESVWGDGKMGIIGYDTTSVMRHTRGKLDDAALWRGVERMRKQLGANAVLIACVHQPLVTAWPQDADEVLIHAGRTARLFSEHGVDMVLSGHVHVPFLATTEGYFQGLPRQFILAGAGTAVSHRTRPGAPNSFNVIRSSDGDAVREMEVTLFCFDGEKGEFVAEPGVRFGCEYGGWVKV